jgi:ApbE superfamily uncharacterized protein (UPF0280 family)
MSEFVLAKVEIEETAATIAADREFLGHAVEAMKAARLDIERQIRRDDFFLTTLEPYDPPPHAPRVISRMCDASRAAGVGPMATVAGAIAQEALEAMASNGCEHAWVDNGGDIALMIKEPVTVEVFSEPGAKQALGLEIEPTEGIIGVCTSSGRLGHSISFGDADASVAIAKDALLADALATAIGNRVTDKASLKTCFEEFKQVSGFTAGVVLRDGDVAIYGKVPRMSQVEHNPERVTAHTKMSSSKYIGHTDSKMEVGA